MSERMQFDGEAAIHWLVMLLCCLAGLCLGLGLGQYVARGL